MKLTNIYTKFIQKGFILTVITMGVVLSSMSSSEEDRSNSLTICVQGIQQVEGSIDFGLYIDPDDFLEIGKEYRKKKVKVKGSKVYCTFSGLKKGYYALAIFHDANENGECDKNFIGYPKEGFGFSNNLKPRFSAPKFEDAKVYVADSKSICINILNE